LTRSQAISSGLSEIKVYDSRAAALEKLGRYKEAIADAEKCVKLYPDAFQVSLPPVGIIFAHLTPYPRDTPVLLVSFSRCPGHRRLR
jgi:tetratricopeptide (TPR) repeat protein